MSFQVKTQGGVTRRRKLPAPPLVLEPVLLRVREEELERLTRLAEFLARRGHLTDGGSKGLSLGLRGRNGYCCLTDQDVRGWAHALVNSLWQTDEERWEAETERYFSCFDKGKPRRPNHLQRLYLDWSDDLSWPGLMRAANGHPRLWAELAVAVDRLHSDHPEKRLWEFALAFREDSTGWKMAWRDHVIERSLLLKMASRLPWSTLKRLCALQGCVESVDPCDRYELICACAAGWNEVLELPPFPELQSLAESLLPYPSLEHRPEFFTGFRAFLREPALLVPLFESLSPRDPLAAVRFGARPGRLWSEAVRDELETLIALRSGSSSR